MKVEIICKIGRQRNNWVPGNTTFFHVSGKAFGIYIPCRNVCLALCHSLIPQIHRIAAFTRKLYPTGRFQYVLSLLSWSLESCCPWHRPPCSMGARPLCSRSMASMSTPERHVDASFLSGHFSHFSPLVLRGFSWPSAVASLLECFRLHANWRAYSKPDVDRFQGQPFKHSRQYNYMHSKQTGAFQQTHHVWHNIIICHIQYNTRCKKHSMVFRAVCLLLGRCSVSTATSPLIPCHERCTILCPCLVRRSKHTLQILKKCDEKEE